MVSETQQDKLIGLFFGFAVLTSSFDVFMNVNFAGFNLRITFLFQFFIMLMALHTIFKRQCVKLPLGFWPLIFWTIALFIFSWNTSFVARNILYHTWLLFFICSTVAMLNVFTKPEQVRAALRWYCYSFGVIAVLGIIQFVIGLMGGNPPFINYWWSGNLPRVHGASFEPSYYGSYMLIGWVITSIFWLRHSELLPVRHTAMLWRLITLAIILSGARTSIGFLVLCAAAYGVYFYYLVMTRQTRPTGRQLQNIMLLAFTGMITIVAIIIPNYEMFLAGTGISGTTSHSFDNRTDIIGYTLRVFFENPVVGVGLGGVGTHIGEQLGRHVTSNDVAADGMMIFAEVLAASGVIAVLFFAYFIYCLIAKPLKLAAISDNPEHKTLLIAMVAALCTELFILQFNQNILRAYLWIHIGVLCLAYRYVMQHTAVDEKTPLHRSHTTPALGS